MKTTNEKNLAAFTHLSTLSQYFIPFGNFIFPILIWNSKKEESEFVDYHGKQVLNFQLSLLLYSLVLATIAIPVFIITILNNTSLKAIVNKEDFLSHHLDLENISGSLIVILLAVLVFAGLKLAEFLLIIYASLKASNGEKYKYPLTISFIK